MNELVNDDPIATMAAARGVASPPDGSGGVPSGSLDEVTLSLAGAGLLTLAWQYVRRLVKQDDERQRAMVAELECLRYSVSDLRVKWNVCESQREEMAADLALIKAMLEKQEGHSG